MKKFEIKVYPQPVLRDKAILVEKFDEKALSELILGMINTMNSHSGIGLAAPQIGLSKRIIVYKTMGEQKQDAQYLINPEIVETSGSIVVEEGCLSVPEITGDVKRHKSIKVKGFDKQGKEILLETDKFWGVVIQHEIDHLNGKLFIDRLSPIKREMALSKYNKKRKGEVGREK